MKKSTLSRIVKILALTAIICALSAFVIACKPDVNSGNENSSSVKPNSSNSSSSTSAPEDEPTLEKGLTSILIGDVRIQLLSETLLRIEDRYEKGFEDRPSYIVQNRENWYVVDYEVVTEGNEKVIKTQSYHVHVANGATAKAPRE